MTPEVPGQSFITVEVHIWFRDVPKNQCLKFQPPMINIIVDGWPICVMMYLGLKYKLSTIHIRVSTAGVVEDTGCCQFRAILTLLSALPCLSNL